MKRDELLLLFGLAALLAIMMFFTSGTYSANFITQEIANQTKIEIDKQTELLSKLLFRQFNNSQTTIQEFDKVFKILSNESKLNLVMINKQNKVIDNIVNNITEINNKLTQLVANK